MTLLSSCLDILLKKEDSKKELILIIVIVITALVILLLLALVTFYYFYRKGNKGRQCAVCVGWMLKFSRLCQFQTNWSQVGGVGVRQTILSWCPGLVPAWNSTLRLRLTLYSFSDKQKLKMRNLTYFELCQVLQIVVFFATGGNSHSQFKYKAILSSNMTDTEKNWLMHRTRELYFSSKPQFWWKGKTTRKNSV